MLVDLLRLREAGRKIPDENLKAMKPDRGRLKYGQVPIRSIGVSPQSFDAEMAAEFRVLMPEGYDLLMTLHEARITRIRDDSIVIAGREDVNHITGAAQVFPQVWWCRIVAVD